MKKTLSLLLALVMVIGLFPVFADEAKVLTAEEAGAVLQGYGAIKGGSDGDLMIDKELKRQDAVIILTRLMGKEADAMATTAMPSFDDITIDYYKPFLAFAEAQKWIEGKGNNKFGFNDVVTVKEFAAMLLRALGHDTMGESYNKVMDLATDLKLFAGVEAQETTPVIRGAAFIMMNNTLETAPKGETRKLRSILGYKKGGALEVSSIKADSAKTIAVEFSREVVDEEAKELAFKVLRGKTDIKVDLTWNAENTIATLTNKNTFAVGDYTVTVMKGEEEFAKQDIKFEQQKVAKIEILSETVAVNPTGGRGYVVFRVYDQYEQDITEHFLGNAVTVNVGIDAASADVNWKNGVITITPNSTKNVQLLTYPQLPITIYDRTSGISVSKTLPTAAKIGSISDFKFTPDKDIVIVNGDLATTVVIPFEAYDQTGQKTTDYKLISDGLILGGANKDQMITSVNAVSVKVQQDPKDANKAQVVARFSGDLVNVNSDLNVIVTALLWNGKNASTNIIFKQANEVHTFRLSNPSSVVAVGDEYVDIPFEALDKEGNKITKLAQLKGKVILSNAEFAENSMGDAVVRVYNKALPKYSDKAGYAFAENGIIFVTSSVTKTANFSQVQISIQKAHAVDALYVADAGTTVALEHGATVGYRVKNNGEVYVKDQYGRYRELAAGETLTIISSDENKITVNGLKSVTFTSHKKNVNIQAVETASKKEEQTTVDFVVNYKDKDGNPQSVKKTVNYISVPSKNIVTYNFDPETKAYVDTKDLSAPKDRDLAYAVGFGVSGNTVTGIRGVILAESKYTTGLTVTNPQEFAVKDSMAYGKKPNDNKAESKTSATATLHHNGNTAQHTYEIMGTTVLPEATRVFTVAELDQDGYITFTENEFEALNDKWLQKFQPKNTGVNSDNVPPAFQGYAPFMFHAVDSYKGSGRLVLSFSIAVDKGEKDAVKLAEGTSQLKIDKTKVKPGDEYRLIAAAANGLSQTIKIRIASPSYYENDTTTPLTVVGVETQKITNPADDLKVEVKFNRAVDKDSVTRTTASDDVFVFDNGTKKTTSALKKDDDSIVVVTIPNADVAVNKDLIIKSGIQVKEKIDALKLAETYKFKLTAVPYTWGAGTHSTTITGMPKPMVTGVNVIPGFGKVDVELTFNTDLDGAATIAANEIKLHKNGTFAATNADAAATISGKTVKATFSTIANWTADKMVLLTLDKTNVKNTNTTADTMEHNYSVLLKLDGTFEDAVKITNIETIKKAANDNQVKVTFNKPVKADGAWTGGAGLTANFDLGGNDAALATLAADGMSLVLKYTDANFGDGNLVIKGVKDTIENEYPDFTWVLANSAETMDKHVWTNQD